MQNRVAKRCRLCREYVGRSRLGLRIRIARVKNDAFDGGKAAEISTDLLALGFAQTNATWIIHQDFGQVSNPSARFASDFVYKNTLQNRKIAESFCLK
jgi:hypothetical protein